MPYDSRTVGAFIVDVRRHLDEQFSHCDPECPSERELVEAFEEGFTVGEFVTCFVEEEDIERAEY